VARSNRFSLLLVLLNWVGLAPASPAQTIPTEARPVERITVGHSTAPLYGPWKFHLGDSPLNPKTHAPLWAEPDFDDSQWETVDLTPRDKSLDPIYGISGMVPGWTVRGHARHWGYAWHRIRVQVEAPAGERLALAGPSAVDDGYQILQDGNLLGSFGGFSTPSPVIYSTQPMMFALPQSPDGSPTTRVLAFRVWMEPSTLKDFPDVGGLRTAPLLGEAGAVAANYQLLRFEDFKADAHLIVLAKLFGLLAIMAFSLILFDRSDRVYLWLGATFLLIMANDTVTVLVAATQHLSVARGDLIRLVILRPLICAAWLMVWWNWFGLHRPSWLPRVAAVLMVLYALSTAMDRGLFFAAVPHPLSSAFSIVPGDQVAIPAADIGVRRLWDTPGGARGLVGSARRDPLGNRTVFWRVPIPIHPPKLVSIWCADHVGRYRQPAAGVRDRRAATAATGEDGAAAASDGA
jgi:hypothetical protein